MRWSRASIINVVVVSSLAMVRPASETRRAGPTPRRACPVPVRKPALQDERPTRGTDDNRTRFDVHRKVRSLGRHTTCSYLEVVMSQRRRVVVLGGIGSIGLTVAVACLILPFASSGRA